MIKLNAKALMTKCLHKCFYLLAEEPKAFLREEIVTQGVTEGAYVTLSLDKLLMISRSPSVTNGVSSISEGALEVV